MAMARRGPRFGHPNSAEPIVVLGTIGIVVVAFVSYQVGLYVDRERVRAINRAWVAEYMSDEEIATAIRQYSAATDDDDDEKDADLTDDDYEIVERDDV